MGLAGTFLGRIEAGENDRTEFKRGLGDLSAVGRTICAFANTEGGVVILGVTDAQEIVGVREDAERVQERLTSFLQNGLQFTGYRSCRAAGGSERLGYTGWRFLASVDSSRYGTMVACGYAANAAALNHRLLSFRNSITRLVTSSPRNARYKLRRQLISICSPSMPISKSSDSTLRMNLSPKMKTTCVIVVW